MLRVCLNCRESKDCTACQCRRAFFCSESCQGKAAEHTKICSQLLEKTQNEEETLAVLQNWISGFCSQENDYSKGVREYLARENAVSFFDRISMHEDEIGFLFTPKLLISRLFKNQMAGALKSIPDDDPLRSNYIELYRTFLFSPKPRAFFELRVLFSSQKMRILRGEIIPKS